VLSHWRRGRRVAESFTVRPEESNSTEQELSAVKRRIERRLWTKEGATRTSGIRRAGRAGGTHRCDRKTRAIRHHDGRRKRGRRANKGEYTGVGSGVVGSTSVRDPLGTPSAEPEWESGRQPGRPRPNQPARTVEQPAAWATRKRHASRSRPPGRRRGEGEPRQRGEPRLRTSEQEVGVAIAETAEDIEDEHAVLHGAAQIAK
jgi:hypothetical protein